MHWSVTCSDHSRTSRIPFPIEVSPVSASFDLPGLPVIKFCGPIPGQFCCFFFFFFFFFTLQWLTPSHTDRHPGTNRGKPHFGLLRPKALVCQSSRDQNSALWIPGRVAQLATCLVTDASLTADTGIASSIPPRSHTFVEIAHEIISTVIRLPSAESFKKGCCQLQAKVCARSTG